MADQSLDDFSDVSTWLPVASGLAKLDITSEPGPGGNALRLGWDFAGGGGFVVARRELRLTLPETWSLRLDLRGAGPHNRLEIKLADPSGENVWWYKIEAFALPDDWTPLVIRSREIEFAWGPQGGGAMKARSGGATLLESPEPGARSFGRLGAGTSVNVTGTVGDLTKVTVGDNRFGFVKTSELEAGGTPSGAVAFEEVMRRYPPAVEVQPLALSTKDDKIQIKGTAQDADKILDGYIFVGNKKVFYRSNRNSGDQQHMTYDATVPLRPGVNVITLVARENVDTVGRRTIIIRRDGANGELLSTPKTEDESETAGGDD